MTRTPSHVRWDRVGRFTLLLVALLLIALYVNPVRTYVAVSYTHLTLPTIYSV